MRGVIEILIERVLIKKSVSEKDREMERAVLFDSEIKQTSPL